MGTVERYSNLLKKGYTLTGHFIRCNLLVPEDGYTLVINSWTWSTIILR